MFNTSHAVRKCGSTSMTKIIQIHLSPELSYDWSLLNNPSIICLIPLSFPKCPLETPRIFATGAQQMSQKKRVFFYSLFAPILTTSRLQTQGAGILGGAPRDVPASPQARPGDGRFTPWSHPASSDLVLALHFEQYLYVSNIAS